MEKMRKRDKNGNASSGKSTDRLSSILRDLCNADSNSNSKNNANNNSNALCFIILFIDFSVGALLFKYKYKSWASCVNTVYTHVKT